MADCLSYICSLLYYIWFQMLYMHHVIVQPCQTCHNNNLNHSTITMKAVSATQRNHILSLLDSGHSGHDISSQTGVSNATISRLCSRHRPYIKKASGGRPSKLSEQDLRYAIRLIGTEKAENAVQVAKALQDSTNQPLSAQTVRNGMKEVGMKAVVKKKRPLLTKHHRRERMDFALSHKGGSGCGKRMGRA